MKKKRKNHSRFIFYRYYCPISLMSCLAAFFVSPSLGFLLFFPVIPAMYLLMNLYAFKFNYSVFGPYERTPFPPGEPIASRSFAYGRVRGLYQIGMGWYVYDEGLGFDTYFNGKGFIPVKYLEKTEKLIFPRIMVWHSSPEIKSPLIMPSSLHAPLKAIIEQRDTNAALPDSVSQSNR